MRFQKLFLVSLTIALLMLLPGGTSTVFAHERYSVCRWYVVHRGETLSGIGRHYGIPWPVLAQYNHLHNPNRIRAGSRLCIPANYRTHYPPGYGNRPPSYPPPTGQPPMATPPPTSQPPVATPPATTTVVVQVRNFEFVPRTVTIKPGTTVVWMRAEGFHNVHAEDGSFGNTPSATWTSFSHTFTTAGTVPYYCEIHGGPGGAGMAGVVIVQ